MLHSKSSETIQCLYAKKSVKQGFNCWKWSCSVNALASHSKAYSRPVAWHNRSRDIQEPIAFHNQVWHKASSGGIFWICRNCSTQDELYCGWRRRSRLFLSQINRLPRKTWNINTFWINYDGSFICLLFLVFYLQMVGLGAGVGLSVHKCVNNEI